MDEINIQGQSLRNDWPRRLRNALIVLAKIDKAWMIWVENHVPAQCDIQIAARLVEVHARTLVMRGYRYFGDGLIQTVIHGDRPFADDGHLAM